MVTDFKGCHRTGKINHQALREFAGRCKAIGGNYCRFSCDNSEPKSIIDQMVESLEKAREEEHFKWVTTTRMQAHQPTQVTPVPNLLLAGAHTKTDVAVWSIEGAVESGRRAAKVVCEEKYVKYTLGRHPTLQ